MTRLQLRFLCCSVVLLLGLGCESNSPPAGPNMAKPFPVSGRITFPDGTPLVGGVITFTPVKVEAGRKVRYEGSSLVDANGKYKIGFNLDGAGVPEGEYKVTIAPRGYQELPKSNVNKIPAPYQDSKTTPIQVMVKDQDNTFDFVLN
jgi:hypothetical protein